jgi:hypothetical protein
MFKILLPCRTSAVTLNVCCILYFKIAGINP